MHTPLLLFIHFALANQPCLSMYCDALKHPLMQFTPENKKHRHEQMILTLLFLAFWKHSYPATSNPPSRTPNIIPTLLFPFPIFPLQISEGYHVYIRPGIVYVQARSRDQNQPHSNLMESLNMQIPNQTEKPMLTSATEKENVCKRAC
jgi:hypothetical protein